MALLRGLNLIFLVVLVSPCCLSYAQNPIQSQIHPLRTQPGSSISHLIPGLNCQSWRLAVETDNLRNWKTVPQECEGYVGRYMLGAQYRKDCFAVTAAAYDYVKSLQLEKDGKDIWVFDIDETCLSSVPFFARPDVAFGAFPINKTSYFEFVAEGKAPAIPAVLHFYRKLLRLGVKTVFLTGAGEAFRVPRERNLRNAGFSIWEMVLLRDGSESNMTALEYKSKRRTELEKKGYRIIGNMGDQWSDILGPHPGLRTFKLPDPMYYLA